ncbi:helix-turn-helix domain-containing protein [Actinomadura graeca]|uniref:Helix-turn-helix domain-containing protein n=1 Tax=Actinomadura graeca TaxID=2750812 RepID=A0ABX8R5U8_9ACTN|nr:helix-turn-helix domain-containing protein [Actinomadura graeca]QXJ25789.1 helix-turn-helix domain-containing protein [Actinomadura graeca]
MIDVPTAASVLGIGEWTAYAMIRRGDWQKDITPILRLGRKIKIPTAQLVALLYGRNAPGPAGEDPGPPPSATASSASGTTAPPPGDVRSTAS